MNDQVKKVARAILPHGLQESLRHLRGNRGVIKRRFKLSFVPSSANSKSAFTFPIKPENPLAELAEKYTPTKRLHNYLPFYWMHFQDIRNQVRSLLEIGVQSGRSLEMWEEFFPNATVYGLDIDPKCKELESGRKRIFIGDQSDYTFLDQVAKEAQGFDIVIDDGSHKIKHQLRSFMYLFPMLSEHGIYVVEDTGGCVGDRKLATVNSLKPLIDSIMYWPEGILEDQWQYLSEFPEGTEWIHRNIIGIAFYRWIVFVMRGQNPRDNPYLLPSTRR